ncbi:MAG: ATP-dependent RecD-like DNA helicase [Aestuariivita sp.]|nr:ATP-dependent RecD-like DNA helicase [Aestuariivita sp.]MCY4347490.1 ATP-dependent RecD-like DNA helicase [Aestuariivita sp.]
MMNSDSSTDEVLAGLVERITFHNEDNGFCVLRVKARGRRELITIVGHTAMISAGEWVTASGFWQNDRNHGFQFKAHFLQTSSPATTEGIQKYLGSGMIPGIGPVYAKCLVDAFGMEVFDVIETMPERLREVEGIGPKRAEKIIESWQDQKVIREIMIFMHQHGVGTALSARIFKTYGTDAVQVMSENPYRLAKDIRGIGFRTADTIAEKLGIEKNAMIRISSGISYALSEATNDGHCGLPSNKLIELAETLLEVSREYVEAGLTQQLNEREVIADNVGGTKCIFLSRLHFAERAIAQDIKRIRAGQLPWRQIDSEKAIPWIEKKTELKLATSQKAAIRLALKSKVVVITGGPGVGKTTIVNAILRILNAKSMKLKLCAPTGRAAKRMYEATGKEAKTIHRLLEFDPSSFGFKRNSRNPLRCDLLVVDEASMVDVRLMQSLLDAIPSSAALLIVGDIDQLPSVGPGQVLADIIDSKAVPVVRLTEVFRQAAQSQIITTAHAINAGRLPNLKAPEKLADFYFVPAEEPDRAVTKIIELVTHRIPSRFSLNPINDIQILCPMNRGGIGAQSLNVDLQAVLNPKPAATIRRFGTTFAAGDRVMQIQNDYEKDVYNGDIGMIERVDPEQGELSVDFDGRSVVFGLAELDTLVLAYATTIHKSQGSEYPAVVIPVMTQHYPMLQRNLIYTGVTRGKKLVIVVGQKKALAIAIRRATGSRRWSKLNEWLADSSVPSTTDPIRR